MRIKPDRDKGSNPKTPLIRIEFREDLSFKQFIRDNWFDTFILVCSILLIIGG